MKVQLKTERSACRRHGALKDDVAAGFFGGGQEGGIGRAALRDADRDGAGGAGRGDGLHDVMQVGLVRLDDAA